MRSSCWYDHWLASGPLSQILVSILNPQLQIKDVWLDNAWDRDVLMALVGAPKAEEIMNSVQAGREGTNDVRNE